MITLSALFQTPLIINTSPFLDMDNFVTTKDIAILEKIMRSTIPLDAPSIDRLKPVSSGGSKEMQANRVINDDNVVMFTASFDPFGVTPAATDLLSSISNNNVDMDLFSSGTVSSHRSQSLQVQSELIPSSSAQATASQVDKFLSSLPDLSFMLQ